MNHARSRWLGALGVIAVILAVIAWQRPNAPVAPTSADTPSTPAAPVDGIPVDISASTCGSGWTTSPAGPVTLALTNTFNEVGDVYLKGKSDGKFYLEVENLGQEASRSATVSLPAGTYQLVCTYTEGGTYVGPDVTITGSYSGATVPGTYPVTDNDLYDPINAYTKWIQSRIPVAQKQVAKLKKDLQQGKTAQAKKDWLTAHMTYGTLGAAYDAFGDLGDDLDGMPSTTVTALKDKDLLGFHKVEALLWAGRKDATIVPYVTKMTKALATLHQQFGHELFMATLDIGLRSHEILEDALKFEVTGRTDAGSHTGLATLSANIVGTRHALSVLDTLLKRDDVNYATMYLWLNRLDKLVGTYHHGSAQNTGWTSLNALTQLQRERLDATLSQTLEYLSQVAVITDPVRSTP